MKLIVILIACFTSAVLAAPPESKSSPGDGAQRKSAPPAKSKTQTQVLTGCVDEQDGNYVLLDDRMLKRLADLQAVGASNEAFFAKHLGHKVTVKGRMSSEPESKFMVTSIEDVAAVCAPPGTNPK